MKQIDIESASKTIGAFLIGALFLYLIVGMMRFGDGYMEKRTADIEQIIDKALVQCYALEGGYPMDLAYIERYGVIFNNEKYFYHYEWQGSNLRPTIIVIEK